MIKLVFLISFLTLALQGCVTDISLKKEDQPLLQFTSYKKMEQEKLSLGYKGPISILTQSVAMSVPGVGTGLAAGAGAVTDDSFANDLDRTAKQNAINITDLLADSFKRQSTENGDLKFVDVNAKVVFTISDITHLFQRLIGKPTYILAATFTISEGDRVVWKYRESLRSDGNEVPEYSYEDLMIPENMKLVFQAAAEKLTQKAIADLKKPEAKR